MAAMTGGEAETATMTERTDQRLAELAESFALTMAQNGMQKATARVLAALVFSPDATMTAGELAEQLRLSSGSISGAIKQLTPIGLIERAPAPGSRRDHFRVRRGAWATLMGGQNAIFDVMQRAARDGIDIAGADSVAGRRLAEMHDFYGYLATELPALIDRWHQRYHGDGR
jgi:hypothetical protein